MSANVSNIMFSSLPSRNLKKENKVKTLPSVVWVCNPVSCSKATT